MELDSNQHSVFLLHYHMVMVVKYRKRVIDDRISKRLREMFDRISANYHISTEVWNSDYDHVHVLFKAHPSSELSKFINAYKSASSRLIKVEFPHIKTQLWNDAFWSKSFCLISTGGVSVEVIEKYIESQGSPK